MILLDTSALIDGLTGPRTSARVLREAFERGERLLLPTLVLYEWLRGPRQPQELAAQEALEDFVDIPDLQASRPGVW